MYSILRKFLRRRFLRPVTTFALIARLVLIAYATVCTADDRNPYAGDPKVAKAGAYAFRINCALCHELGAHGGGRGPDPTRAHQQPAHNRADMLHWRNNDHAA